MVDVDLNTLVSSKAAVNGVALRSADMEFLLEIFLKIFSVFSLFLWSIKHQNASIKSVPYSFCTQYECEQPDVLPVVHQLVFTVCC